MTVVVQTVGFDTDLFKYGLVAVLVCASDLLKVPLKVILPTVWLKARVGPSPVVRSSDAPSTTHLNTSIHIFLSSPLDKLQSSALVQAVSLQIVPSLQVLLQSTLFVPAWSQLIQYVNEFVASLH